MLTFLCAVSLCHTILWHETTLASTDAAQRAIAATTTIKIKETKTMYSRNLLCMIMPTCLDEAKQDLAQAQERFKKSKFQKAKPILRSETKKQYWGQAYWATYYRLKSCTDQAERVTLGKHLTYSLGQIMKTSAASDEALTSLTSDDRVPRDAYEFMSQRCDIADKQASLLLAQNEQLQQQIAQLLEEKTQSKQANQKLFTQAHRLQLCVDSPKKEVN